MTFKEQDFQSIASGTFKLDIVELELIRHDLCIQGNGYLFQKENGQLGIKVYVKPGGELDLNKCIDEINFINSSYGKLIPSKKYFKLTGKAVNQSLVLSDRVRLHFGFETSIIYGTILGSIKLKNSHELLSDIVYARIMVFPNLDFPKNGVESTITELEGKILEKSQKLNTWLLEKNDLNITIKPYYNNTQIEISAKNLQACFNNELPAAIVHSLNFLTARKTTGFFLFSRDKHDREQYELNFEKSKTFINYKIYPPLSCWDSDNILFFTDLFLNYLAFINSGKGVNLKSIVNKTIDSSLSYESVYASVLSISVEGLIKTYLSDFKRTDLKEVTDFNNAMDLIKSADLMDKTKERLCRTIENFKVQLNPYAIMREISSKGIISKNLPDKWKKLRNSELHFNSKTNLEKLINGCDSLLSLYYQLIYLIIGYEGLFTDYSKNDFPTETFKSKN